MFRWRVADVTVRAGWSRGWGPGFSYQLEQRERKWVLSFCVGCFNILIVLSCTPASSDVFRGCGGARSAHNMVPLELFRHQALTLVQQLLLTQGGDDDMGTLLGVMHGAASTEVKLKSDILKVWRQPSFLILLFVYCVSFFCSRCCKSCAKVIEREQSSEKLVALFTLYQFSCRWKAASAILPNLPGTQVGHVAPQTQQQQQSSTDL